MPELGKAELFVYENPDSTWAILEKIDTINLSSQEKAIYNLLFTQYKIGTNYPVSGLNSLLDYSIGYFEETRQTRFLAKALLNKARLKNMEQKPEEAIEHLHSSMALLKKNPDNFLTGMIYNETGNTFWRQTLIQKAIVEHEKAYRHGQKINDSITICFSLRYLGRDYLFKPDLDSALIYMEKALEYSQGLHNKELCSAIYNNLCMIHTRRKEYEKALSYNMEAIKLAGNDTLKLYKNYGARGNIFLQKTNYDSARFYLNQSKLSKDIETKAISFYDLSYILRQEGEKDSALFYSNQYILLTDSIKKMNKSIETTEAANQYNTHLLITKEKEKKKYWIIFSLFIIGIALFSFYVIYRTHQKKKEKQLGTLKTIIQEKSQEINYLKKQANNILLEQKEKDKYYEELINKKESEVVELIDQTGNICKKRFQNSKVYKETKMHVRHSKKTTIVLTQTQQKKLFETLDKTFEGFIEYLKAICSDITNDECILCCLAKSGFTPAECASCRAVTLNAIWVQKSRLKTKMGKKTSTSVLFEHIFLNF